MKEHPVSIPWGIYILDKKYEGRSLNEFKESDDFPPPWVLQRDSHPYGTAWEMGVNYLEHFDIWWEKHDFTLQEKISYFMRWPPPPRWLGWMAQHFWEIEGMSIDVDYSDYFLKLKEYGFTGMEDYEDDICDRYAGASLFRAVYKRSK